MNATANKMGNRLREFRTRRGMTLKAVATAIGVAPSTYRDWEYGKAICGEPYVELARVFGVTLDELLTGESTPNQDPQHILMELEKKLDDLKKSLGA